MTGDRFGTGAGRYDAARPAHPDDFIARLAASLPDGSGVVLDVGAGTGILTRQLAAVLPASSVVGLEPSEAMRAQAVEGGGPAYAAGRAEALPLNDGAARAVVAGAAAHWFDRPAFYAEAARVLVPGGVLAILDYPRDEVGSRAAAAAEAFLRRFGAKAYVRPDYADELTREAAFEVQEALEVSVEDRLSLAAFAELILSSSHARAAETVLGEEGARKAIADLAAELVEADGCIAYGYRFRMTLARRA